MKRILIIVAVLLGLASSASAQVATPQTAVQQVATRFDAAIRCDSSTGVGATNTLTLLNPGPGLADYITMLMGSVEATGTIAAAAPIAITSTGINGTAPTFGSLNLIGGTIGYLSTVGPMNFPTPVKANSNTAPTFVIATVTNGTSRLTACYFQAP